MGTVGTGFTDQVRELAAAKEWSLERVGHEAWDPDTPGTSLALFRKVLLGKRALTPALMERIAYVLDVEPETFGEYRLAMARQLFDEREVGLDRALENLTAVEEAAGAELEDFAAAASGSRARARAGRGRRPRKRRASPARTGKGARG